MKKQYNELKELFENQKRQMRDELAQWKAKPEVKAEPFSSKPP